MKKQKVTHIAISAVSGGHFSFKVCNDSMEFSFCRQIILTFLRDAKDSERQIQLKNILRVYDEWGGGDWSTAHRTIYVAGACIGSVTFSCDEMYGIEAQVIPQVKKYHVTVYLSASPYTWKNVIVAKSGNDVVGVVREVLGTSGMKGIPPRHGEWFREAAKYISMYSNEIRVSGSVIGRIKIEEINDGS